MNKEFFNRGVLLINKKPGRTSHDEVAIIKRALRSIEVDVKVGHSGTLDPKVTGLLVVGIGLGTKILEYMLLSEKRYIGEIVFHKDISQEKIEDAIKHFTGTITQLPPIKSSVKRELRDREVYGISMQSFNKETRTAVLECAVERGTYIRKLFHDMGEYIGIRAHMGDLHRTHVGPFAETKGLITTDEFALLIEKTKSWNLFVKKGVEKKIQSILRPLREAIPSFPQVLLHPGIEKYLETGSDVFVPGVRDVSVLFKRGDLVGVYTNEGVLVALGEAGMGSKDMLTRKKGIAVITKKILI